MYLAPHDQLSVVDQIEPIANNNESADDQLKDHTGVEPWDNEHNQEDSGNDP